MNVFYGYKLGHPIPKLHVFQKLVETKLELRKMKDREATENRTRNLCPMHECILWLQTWASDSEARRLSEAC
jgi:hypothetical protein